MLVMLTEYDLHALVGELDGSFIKRGAQVGTGSLSFTPWEPPCGMQGGWKGLGTYLSLNFQAYHSLSPLIHGKGDGKVLGRTSL